MSKAKLIKGLKNTIMALDAALDEQQRAANGQFGSGSGSSTKKPHPRYSEIPTGGSQKAGYTESTTGTYAGQKAAVKAAEKMGVEIQTQRDPQTGKIGITYKGETTHAQREKIKKAATGDSQQRATNGQFGSGGGSSSPSKKHQEAGQAASRAFAGGSSTAAKNAARLRQQMSQGKSTGLTGTGAGGGGKVETGTARLKSTLASNAARSGKN